MQLAIWGMHSTCTAGQGWHVLQGSYIRGHVVMFRKLDPRAACIVFFHWMFILAGCQLRQVPAGCQLRQVPAQQVVSAKLY